MRNTSLSTRVVTARYIYDKHCGIRGFRCHECPLCFGNNPYGITCAQYVRDYPLDEFEIKLGGAQK